MSKGKWRNDRRTKDQERQFHADFVMTDLPDWPIERLRELAIEHYNEDVRKPYQTPADEQADESFLDRLCVNYARHRLIKGYDASYDRPMQSLSRDERKRIAKTTALVQIGVKWPMLAEECEWQMRNP
jgi:hypothetical protein